GEVADDAIENLHRAGRIDLDTRLSAARTVDEQAVQADVVANAGVDGDGGVGTAGLDDAGEAVALDADAVIDGQRPVAGRIEHVDLAVGRGRVEGLLEGAAGPLESAGMGVRA